MLNYLMVDIARTIRATIQPHEKLPHVRKTTHVDAGYVVRYEVSCDAFAVP